MPINKRKPAQAPNGETAYSHIHETEQEQEAHSRDMGRIGIAVAAIGGLAGALVFGGGMFLLKKTGEEAMNANLGGKSSISTHQAPGEAVSLEQSRTQEIASGESILASLRSKSTAQLQSEGYTITPDGSRDASSEDLNDLMFVDMHSVQQIAKTDMATARKALASILSPESSNFEHYEKQLGTGAAPFKYNAYDVVAETKDFYRNNLLAHDGSPLVESNGRAMRVTINYYSSDPKASGAGEMREVVYQRVGMVDENGKESEKWMTMEIIQPGDVNFINDLRPIDTNYS